MKSVRKGGADMPSKTIALKKEIMDILQNVKDPEIKPISIVELGMVEDIEITENTIHVKLLPTFTGCPALDLIKENIKNEVKDALSSLDNKFHVDVKYCYHPPWTTKRISEEGRKKLKKFGIATPSPDHNPGDPWEIECPYCNSTNITMENIFGPAACRSILYCRQCRNPFEAMKPIA